MIARSVQPSPQPHANGTAATTAMSGTAMKPPMRTFSKVPMGSGSISGMACGRALVVGVPAGRKSYGYASETYGGVGYARCPVEFGQTCRVGHTTVAASQH